MRQQSKEWKTAPSAIVPYVNDCALGTTTFLNPGRKARDVVFVALHPAKAEICDVFRDSSSSIFCERIPFPCRHRSSNQIDSPLSLGGTVLILELNGRSLGSRLAELHPEEPDVTQLSSSSTPPELG